MKKAQIPATQESYACGVCTHLMDVVSTTRYECKRCNRTVYWTPGRVDPTTALMLQAMWELHLDDVYDQADQA